VQKGGGQSRGPKLASVFPSKGKRGLPSNEYWTKKRGEEPSAAEVESCRRRKRKGGERKRPGRAASKKEKKPRPISSKKKKEKGERERSLPAWRSRGGEGVAAGHAKRAAFHRERRGRRGGVLSARKACGGKEKRGESRDQVDESEKTGAHAVIDPRKKKGKGKACECEVQRGAGRADRARGCVEWLRDTKNIGGREERKGDKKMEPRPSLLGGTKKKRGKRGKLFSRREGERDAECK